MNDEIEANPTANSSPNSPPRPRPRPCEFGKHDETYIMNKLKRTAVIFNHYKFEADAHVMDKTLETREGTKKDAVDLEKILETLHFNVTVHDDLRVNEIRNEIRELKKGDYSDQDCLAIFVFTHGYCGNKLAAYNGWYKSEELWNSFTGTCCPSLAGKPKLLFINACRGVKIDQGVAFVNFPKGVDGIIKPNNYHFHIPEMADMLFALSTVDDYVSNRNTRKGSWFIQALCKNLLDEEIGRKELREILTITSRDVAGMITIDKNHETITQVPTFSSTLLRNLYLKDNLSI